MGILGHITNDQSSSNDQSTSLCSGGHAIDKSLALSPTDPGAINPMNAGSWESVRTTPVNVTPRYFNKAEADALKQLATEKVQGARQSKRAYKSLSKIENADAVVHRHHRTYIKGVADSELTKKRADASTAKHLHALRPEYAKLGFGVDRADGKAQQRIDELKAKIKDCY